MPFWLMWPPAPRPLLAAFPEHALMAKCGRVCRSVEHARQWPAARRFCYLALERLEDRDRVRELAGLVAEGDYRWAIPVRQRGGYHGSEKTKGGDE